MAEAMAEGRCVIATGWSGNLDFMDDSCTLLLPFTLRPVVDPTGGYQPEGETCWAEPDFEAGVAALRRLASDPDLRRTLGVAARQAIATRLGPQIYREALLAPQDIGKLAAR